MEPGTSQAAIKKEMDDSGCIQDDPSSNFRVGLMDLSDDVLLYILSYVNPRDLKALGFTCARLGYLIKDHTLWNEVDTRSEPCGRARLRWYLKHCLNEQTKMLLLAGFAREADGCQGHTRPSEDDNENTSDSENQPGTSGSGTKRSHRGSPRTSDRLVAASLGGGLGEARVIVTTGWHSNTQNTPRFSVSPSWVAPDDEENDFQPAEFKDGCAGPMFTMSRSLFFSLASRCPSLTSLALDFCNINCQVTSLAYFPNTLKVLSLRGSRCYNLPMDKSFMFKVHEYLPSLESLDVSGCNWFEPAALLPLSKHRTLQTLRAQRCPLLAEFVAYSSLATRFGFRTLQVLDLRGSPLGDTEVASFGWLPSLSELYVSVCDINPQQPPSHTHKQNTHRPLESVDERRDWELLEPEYYRDVPDIQRTPDRTIPEDPITPTVVRDFQNIMGSVFSARMRRVADDEQGSAHRNAMRAQNRAARNQGNNAREERNAGINAGDARNDGNNVRDERNAGINARVERNAGIDAREERNAGINVEDEGIAARDLRIPGNNARGEINAENNVRDEINAGNDARVERHAGNYARAQRHARNNARVDRNAGGDVANVGDRRNAGGDAANARGERIGDARYERWNPDRELRRIALGFLREARDPRRVGRPVYLENDIDRIIDEGHVALREAFRNANMGHVFDEDVQGEAVNARYDALNAGGEARNARNEARNARGEARNLRGGDVNARGEAVNVRDEVRNVGGEAREAARNARCEARHAREEARNFCGEAENARDEAKKTSGEGENAKDSANKADGEVRNAEKDAKIADGGAKNAKDEAKNAGGEPINTKDRAKSASAEARNARYERRNAGDIAMIDKDVGIEEKRDDKNKNEKVRDVQSQKSNNIKKSDSGIDETVEKSVKDGKGKAKNKRGAKGDIITPPKKRKFDAGEGSSNQPDNFEELEQDEEEMPEDEVNAGASTSNDRVPPRKYIKFRRDRSPVVIDHDDMGNVSYARNVNINFNFNNGGGQAGNQAEQAGNNDDQAENDANLAAEAAIQAAQAANQAAQAANQAAQAANLAAEDANQAAQVANEAEPAAMRLEIAQEDAPIEIDPGAHLGRENADGENAAEYHDPAGRFHIQYIDVPRDNHAIVALDIGNEVPRVDLHIRQQRHEFNILNVMARRRCNRMAYLSNSFYSLPSAHLDPASLVTDSAIQKFGHSDGENANQVHMGPYVYYGGRGDRVLFNGEGANRPNKSNLRKLVCTGYNGITNISLVHLATAAPYLKFVDFSQTRVTAAGVENFKSIRPDCEVRCNQFIKPEQERGFAGIEFFRC